jgi:hypothetical protein
MIQQIEGACCLMYSVPGNVVDLNMFKLEKLQEMASAQNILLQKIIPTIEVG